MSNGKGDGPRPKSVTEQEYAARWDQTFARLREHNQVDISQAGASPRETAPDPARRTEPPMESA